MPSMADDDISPDNIALAELVKKIQETNKSEITGAMLFYTTVDGNAFGVVWVHEYAAPPKDGESVDEAMLDVVEEGIKARRAQLKRAHEEKN
jgi:hypothetical protein